MVEIMDNLDMSDKKYFRSAILNPLMANGLLRLTIPNKPKSPKQKYIKVSK